MTHTIKCRARVTDDCYDGSPAARQFGEDAPMGADNTFDGESIVCDACYALLCDYTPSGQALHDELPGAIAGLRAQVAYLSGHLHPAELAAEAEAAAATVGTGTPLHRSAKVLAMLARREVEKRATA